MMSGSREGEGEGEYEQNDERGASHDLGGLEPRLAQPLAPRSAVGEAARCARHVARLLLRSRLRRLHHRGPHLGPAASGSCPGIAEPGIAGDEEESGHTQPEQAVVEQRSRELRQCSVVLRYRPVSRGGLQRHEAHGLEYAPE